jgi:predicted MPP superfamily phosphohydrolase
MRPVTAAAPLAIAATGAAALTYAAGYEVRAFRLRRFDVPVLAASDRPLRVLHISDAHLTPRQSRKWAWLRSLAGLEPDLVVNTGDSIAHPAAVPALVDALGLLLDRPGVFVFGSNDYYSPRPVNPLRYLVPGSRPAPDRQLDLPWAELREAFQSAGWLDLSNARTRVKVDGRELEFVGVDDPHIDRDRYSDVAGPADPAADLAIGVTHSPEPRVLDRMAADGFQLLLAGHTHGGQVCLPYWGALVTNCELDRARAKGLHDYAGAWLHVSAGLGTSPYVPIRFACPPEATLLTLTPDGRTR